ncbi:hypothetical protein B0D71_19680 [Pseudomonas laurylsulfativorans]|uniref:DUF1120 domain-containing protein n=1 Tax=Pseudomonas laurylsulfativorans TaxID=1943631 RepID=A0A2S3VL48_9PSED|nr:DUF1120 domain-containing protein [Pseudomonas laurylsulfativorans]POF40694.1 hypothetical protein B0D71_19680 [Pseudomonas laurylsulfativorans]
MKLSHPLLLTLGTLMLSGLAPQAWALADDCQLTLSQPVLDYGVMNRAIRAQVPAERTLGERRLSLNLNCPHPTDMTLFYRAMAATAERFRFTEHGSYAVRMGDAVLDGQPVDLGLISSVGQLPEQTASSLPWRPQQAIVPVRGGMAVRGQSLSAQLELTAWTPENALQVRDAVVWETTGLFDAVATGRTREITLRASFAPVACNVDLSNGGQVDFGRLSINDLNLDKDTRLPPKDLTLRIGCDAPTQFALVMHDNRPGTATVNSGIYYGLGLDKRNNKIGLYSLTVNPANASVDSFTRMYQTGSTTRGGAWSTSSSNPVAIAQQSYLGFTDSTASIAGPAFIQSLTTTVTVDAVIAPTASLDLSTAVHLDGSGTIEMFYP